MDDPPCTCSHRPDVHNRLGECLLCDCSDFTSDDTALAAAVGVLVESGETR